MKYKVKYWDDSKRVFKTLYYPYLETALMMANIICHHTHDKVFITDGTSKGSYIVEA